MSLRLLGVSVAAIYEPHRRSFDELAKTLGWDVHLACPSELAFGPSTLRTRFSPVPQNASYTLHPLEHRLQSKQRLHWFVGLERLINRVRPNIVFVEYDPGSLSVLHAKMPACGQRVVAFSVENIERRRLDDCLRNLKERNLKAAFRDGCGAALNATGWKAADGLACVSQEGKRIFRRQGWRKPVEVMPIGTDMHAYSSGSETALRRELKIQDSFVVAYFGRLVPEKGVHVLIDAIAKTDRNVTLLLDMYANFAPGSYADQLLQRADELGIRERVVTIDVPHSDVPRYMRCADIVVLPSLTTDRWKEQFGRVLPEAMACEVPVIGTRTGNIPDIIGDAGILVPERDPDSLVAAIESLRVDPARRQALGRAGRDRVSRHFSLNAQALALERLVAQL